MKEFWIHFEKALFGETTYPSRNNVIQQILFLFNYYVTGLTNHLKQNPKNNNRMKRSHYNFILVLKAIGNS